MTLDLLTFMTNLFTKHQVFSTQNIKLSDSDVLVHIIFSTQNIKLEAYEQLAFVSDQRLGHYDRTPDGVKISAWNVVNWSYNPLLQDFVFGLTNN